MKILLINKFLYPQGGDSIMALETGKLLSKKGHEVVFWGMNHPKNQYFPYQDYFISNIDYNKHLKIFQKLKYSLKIIYSFEAKSKINIILKKLKPDIVHLNNFAHQISPSILDVFKKYQIPVVMTIHDYKLVCPAYIMLLNNKICERCKNGRYYYCFLNKCTKGSMPKSFVNTIEMYLHHKILKIYNNIDVFISPSKFLINKLKEMGFNGDIVYLPNFVNSEEFIPQYQFYEKAVCYIGRLSSEKGLQTLIKAMVGLNIQLKIIGDGPIKNILEARVKDLKLQNIRFLGFKSGNELKEEIARSMAVVLPSEWYENNPRSVLEAFALGKPVIGAKIGGIPELIKNYKTGLTFIPGNANDLSKKITFLSNNPKMIKVMGRNARKYVEDNYNSLIYYQKLIKIYKEAIKNK